MLHTLQNKQCKNIHQLTIKNVIITNKTKPSHQSNINLNSIETKRILPTTQSNFHHFKTSKIQQLSRPPNLIRQSINQQNFSNKISLYPKVQKNSSLQTNQQPIYQDTISKSSQIIFKEQIKISQNSLTFSTPNDYPIKHSTPKRNTQSHYIDQNRKKTFNEIKTLKSKSFHQTPNHIKRENSLNYNINQRCQKGETIDEEIQQLFQQNLQRINLEKQPPNNKYKQIPPKIATYHKPSQKENKVEKERIVMQQQKTLLLDSNWNVIISGLLFAILILILQTIR